MREIKFRAWDKIEKQMVEVLNLHFENDPAPFFVHIYNHAMNDDYWTNTDESILMQYTGLKDKNGKEIYEGDILKVGKHIGEISYREMLYGGYGLSIEYSDGFDEGYFGGCPANNWLAKYEEIEVIGNIYEQPELINKREPKQDS